MNYQIISSGSHGNAVIIEKFILVDCGVSFKKLTPYYKDLKIVLLTHIHSDHFHRSTIKRLAKERPTLRFACGKHLLNDLLNCEVLPQNIDLIAPGNTYHYKRVLIEPVELVHDVPNYGYKLLINDKKILYATDTSELNFNAAGFDLYLLEANYENDEELENRSDNEYYKNRVKHTHLSKEKMHSFLLANAKENSMFDYLHEHKEKVATDEKLI